MLRDVKESKGVFSGGLGNNFGVFLLNLGILGRFGEAGGHDRS